jgi:hypothetical protein
MVISDELLGERLKPRHELHAVQVSFRDEGHVHLCTDRVESNRKRSVCRIQVVGVGWLRVKTGGRGAVQSIQCVSLSQNRYGCVRVASHEVSESVDLVLLKVEFHGGIALKVVVHDRIVLTMTNFHGCDVEMTEI